MVEIASKPKDYTEIAGWFIPDARVIFDLLLDTQAETGDVVELGAYLGRSAVIIGSHVRPDERFVVVDLFGNDEKIVGDTSNQAENKRSYSTLTRRQFESNYLAFHDSLPEIVEGQSSEIVNHVAPNSVRFMHVDASHLYPQVHVDALNAHKLLRANGLVVFDDYRSHHTPGVAA